MIPRKLALKIWAACLSSQARHLQSLTSDRAAGVARRRSGDAGVHGADAKAPGRAHRADILIQQANTLRGWVDVPARRGGELDPGLVGLVSAYLFGHGTAIPCIKAWLQLRGQAGLIDGVDTADAPAVIARLLSNL